VNFKFEIKAVFSVPQMARARATDTPQVTRPVVLTLWQDTRHPWQASGRRFASVMTIASKRCATLFSLFPFFLSPLSLFAGIGKGDISKESFSAKETGPEPSY
jgi:hypothetical protein